MAKRWLVPKSVNGSKPRYNQFSVQLVDPFSDQNGAVVSYTVVVTNMQPNQHMDKYPELLSTWARTIGAGQSGTYQVGLVIHARLPTETRKPGEKGTLK